MQLKINIDIKAGKYVQILIQVWMVTDRELNAHNRNRWHRSESILRKSRRGEGQEEGSWELFSRFCVLAGALQGTVPHPR